MRRYLLDTGIAQDFINNRRGVRERAVGKTNLYRDHPDPDHRRWGRKYPTFPGVAECVRLLRTRKARGVWIDIIHLELTENAGSHLHELVDAFRTETDEWP